MRKLKLHLLDLQVESFETATAQGEKGTVFGEQCTCETACTCPGCATCEASCNGTCNGTCSPCVTGPSECVWYSCNCWEQW